MRWHKLGEGNLMAAKGKQPQSEMQYRSMMTHITLLQLQADTSDEDLASIFPALFAGERESQIFTAMSCWTKI